MRSPIRVPFRGVKAAVLPAALALLPGCALFQRIAAATFEQPRLTFRSWSVDELDPEGLTISLEYALENPNSASFRVQGASYDLEVEQKRAAGGEIQEPVDVPGHATVPLRIPVRVRFADLPLLLDLIGSRESLRYRVTGQAQVDTPVGRMELPFEHRDRLVLPW